MWVEQIRFSSLMTLCSQQFPVWIARGIHNDKKNREGKRPHNQHKTGIGWEWNSLLNEVSLGEGAGSEICASKKSPPRCLLHSTNIPVKVVANDLFISLEVSFKIHLIKLSPPRTAFHRIQTKLFQKFLTVDMAWRNDQQLFDSWPVCVSLEFNYFGFFPSTHHQSFILHKFWPTHTILFCLTHLLFYLELIASLLIV